MSGYTAYELKALEHSPEALEAAADYNDCREAEADAQDWSECAVFHRNRAYELRVQATAERARIDQGRPPQSDASAEGPRPCEMCGDAPCQGCNKCCGSKLGRDPEDGSCLGCG